MQKFVGRAEKNNQDISLQHGVSNNFYVGPIPLLWACAV